MNYLAHLFLAGDNKGRILGALLEDYVVGGVDNETNSKLPEDVKDGLRLHRFIDYFTDNHEELKDVKKLFYPKFGKYAPVVVDVILDHYLQKNWELFSDEPFDVFKNRVHHTLSNDYQDLHPRGLRRLIVSMLRHDWLKHYIDFWGLEKSLSSLNRRVDQLDLTDSIEVMKENYDFINEKFLIFFEELYAESKKQIESYGR